MSENAISARADGVYAVSGRLTFQTVPKFLAETGRGWPEGSGRITIDLGAVTLADSAGLALLLEWLEQAKSSRRELVFTNIPDQVGDLIRVNGLQQVFAYPD